MKKFIEFLCKPAVAVVTGLVFFTVGLTTAPANASVDVLRAHGLKAIGVYAGVLLVLLVARTVLRSKTAAPVRVEAEAE